VDDTFEFTRSVDDRLNALRAAGRTAPPGTRSLGSIALERTAEQGDRIIVVEGEQRLTRSELLDAACRLGGALHSRGVQPGASIAFQMPNWWEACVINLAAALFSYRLVPLLTIYRKAELSSILPVCGVQAIFIPERHRGFDYPSLVAQVPDRPQHVFTVRGERGAQDSFDTLLRSPPIDAVPAATDDVKTILFTSGSTGRPKGVLHTHGALEALVRQAGEFWDIGEDDKLYVPSPIGHVGGSLYAFEFPWITGCTAILAETWEPAAAVKTIDTAGATFMAGATPFLKQLIEAAEAAGSSLPGLRRFVCGGASVSPELIRRGLDRFPCAVVSRAYGSTEIPLVCPGIRGRAEAEAHADTDGEIRTDVQILDNQGVAVAEGETGEIVARGPQMLIGYLDPADDTDSFTGDGFFRMGDLGRRIDRRFLEITGRKKDIIIRKGENISPLEIENALGRHPAIRQAAVIGAPDPERGEIVVAFVVLAENHTFALADMRDHLDKMGLARQKVPERLHVVSSLPMNSVGKVQKQELKPLAAQVELGGV
jgi:acyl-CoA synthetase (AMP-forming)/AMP-acid ligase II